MHYNKVDFFLIVQTCSHQIIFLIWYRKRAIKTWSDGLGHKATYVALMRIFYEDKNIRMVEKLIAQLDALE